MVHVAYVLFDGKGLYSKFVGTSMTSMFENANPMPPPWITVHILHDNTLTEENHDKLVYIAGRYGQQIKFYNIEKICADKIAEIKKIILSSLDSESRISAFYKFLVADVVPDELEKIIYLDADTIVNLDINELWQIDLGDKIFGAVTEPSNGTNSQEFFELCRRGIVGDDDYINGGLIFMNLKIFRKQSYRLMEGLKFEAENRASIIYFDQDVFNYCFSKEYLKLPNKFNYFKCFNAPTPGEVIEKNIYHYIASTLQFNTRSPFNRIWFKYFAKTPWFNENIFANIFESVAKIYNEQKNFSIQVTKLVSGKERGFFIAEENIAAVKNIFAVEEGEEIIFAESIENLIQSMKNSQGKKIFFIFIGNFAQVANRLVSEGFAFGKDFLNGLEFLSEEHGMFFNTASMISNL